MANKEIVEEVRQRIPEDTSLHEIAEKIEFTERKRLAELDRGDRIPIDEVERELPAWIIK
jgi:hypothetical protein